MDTDRRDRQDGYDAVERRRISESMQYGIDLREIDRSELTAGEDDIYAVYVADLDRFEDDERPAPLTVGLMHMIQQKYGDSTVTEIDEFVYGGT